MSYLRKQQKNRITCNLIEKILIVLMIENFNKKKDEIKIIKKDITKIAVISIEDTLLITIK